MHRMPSEVTKWLSGDHNFTTNLLAEISYVLGTPISGADPCPSLLCEGGASRGDAAVSGTVLGYGIAPDDTRELNDPGGCWIGRVELPMPAASSLSEKAARAGMTLRGYIEETLLRKSEERDFSARDLAGAWGEECPDIEEIRAARTTNGIEGLWDNI